MQQAKPHQAQSCSAGSCSPQKQALSRYSQTPAFRYTPPRLQLALERGPSPAAYAASAAADVPKIAAFWAGVRDRTLARLDALTREDAPLDIRPHPDCPDTYALQIKPFGLALSANPCN